jgi:hypothetical protein
MYFSIRNVIALFLRFLKRYVLNKVSVDFMNFLFMCVCVVCVVWCGCVCVCVVWCGCGCGCVCVCGLQGIVQWDGLQVVNWTAKERCNRVFLYVAQAEFQS